MGEGLPQGINENMIIDVTLAYPHFPTWFLSCDTFSDLGHTSRYYNVMRKKSEGRRVDVQVPTGCGSKLRMRQRLLPFTEVLLSCDFALRARQNSHIF